MSSNSTGIPDHATLDTALKLSTGRIRRLLDEGFPLMVRPTSCPEEWKPLLSPYLECEFLNQNLGLPPEALIASMLTPNAIEHLWSFMADQLESAQEDSSRLQQFMVQNALTALDHTRIQEVFGWYLWYVCDAPGVIAAQLFGRRFIAHFQQPLRREEDASDDDAFIAELQRKDERNRSFVRLYSLVENSRPQPLLVAPESLRVTQPTGHTGDGDAWCRLYWSHIQSRQKEVFTVAFDEQAKPAQDERPHLVLQIGDGWSEENVHVCLQIRELLQRARSLRHMLSARLGVRDYPSLLPEIFGLEHPQRATSAPSDVPAADRLTLLIELMQAIEACIKPGLLRREASVAAFRVLTPDLPTRRLARLIGAVPTSLSSQWSNGVKYLADELPPHLRPLFVELARQVTGSWKRR